MFVLKASRITCGCCDWSAIAAHELANTVVPCLNILCSPHCRGCDCCHVLLDYLYDEFDGVHSQKSIRRALRKQRHTWRQLKDMAAMPSVCPMPYQLVAPPKASAGAYARTKRDLKRQRYAEWKEWLEGMVGLEPDNLCEWISTETRGASCA